jgi:hypothetical protein
MLSNNKRTEDDIGEQMISLKDTSDLFALTTFVKRHLSIKHSKAQQITAWAIGLSSYNHACSVIKDTPSYFIAEHDFSLRVIEMHEINAVEVIDRVNLKQSLIKSLHEYGDLKESRNILLPQTDSFYTSDVTLSEDEDQAAYDTALRAYLHAHNGDFSNVCSTAKSQHDDMDLLWEREVVMLAAYDKMKAVGFSVNDESKIGFEDSERFADTMTYKGKVYGLEIVFNIEYDERYMSGYFGVTNAYFQLCEVEDGVWHDVLDCYSLGSVEHSFKKNGVPDDVTVWAKNRLTKGTKALTPYLGRLLWF